MPAYSWYVLGLLLATYTCSWMDRFVVVIVLEPMKAELGLSDALLGAISGFTFAAVYSFAGIPLARLADRGTRRSILAAGLTLWSAMTALFGLARGAPQLVAARLGVALGEASCSPTAHALISDYFPPRRRGTAFAVYGLGASLGMALGLAVGGWCAEAYGWRSAFLVASVPGLILAVLVRLTLREPKRGQSEEGAVDERKFHLRDALRILLSRRSFPAYGVGLALITFSDAAFSTWSPTYLIRVKSMGAAEVGAWMGTLSAIAGCVGTIGGGVIADWLGRRDPRWYLWVPAGSAALMIVSIYLFLHLSGAAIFAFYFAAVLFAATYMGPMFAITHRIFPVRMRALSSAVLLLLLNFIGVGAGAAVAGAMNDMFAVSAGGGAMRQSLTITLFAAGLGCVLVLYAARTLRADLSQSVRITNHDPYCGQIRSVED